VTAKPQRCSWVAGLWSWADCCC